MQLSIRTKRGFIMLSRIWTKTQTQTTIKALRVAGYNVVKIDSGYSLTINNEILFKAMLGSNGYLVRYNENLFA